MPLPLLNPVSRVSWHYIPSPTQFFSATRYEWAEGRIRGFEQGKRQINKTEQKAWPSQVKPLLGTQTECWVLPFLLLVPPSSASWSGSQNQSQNSPAKCSLLPEVTPCMKPGTRRVRTRTVVWAAELPEQALEVEILPSESGLDWCSLKMEP